MRPANPRAASRVAAERLIEGSPEAAEQLALLSLRRSPYLAEAVRTLGEARNRLEPGSGNELMLLAGRLGWRDLPTQIWLIEQAVLTEHPEVAVQRAEALVRQNFEPETTFALLRQLSAEPQPRAALVRSLAERPAWRARFLRSRSVPGTDWPLLAALLRHLARTSAPPTRAEANPTIEGLATFKSFAEAHQLYQHLFVPAGGPRTVLEAGALNIRDRPRDPAHEPTIFEWRLQTVEGAGADVERAGRNGAGLVLIAHTSGTASGPLAVRTILVPPGSYRLRYRIRSDAPDAPTSFPLILFCAGGAALGAATRADLPGADWQVREIPFTLPADCPTMHVQLLAAPSRDGKSREAELGDFALVPQKS